MTTTPHYSISTQRRLVPDFREIARHWHLIWLFAFRQIRLRYKQTMFGFVWTIVPPAFVTMLYVLFFGQLLRIEYSGPNYAIYVLLGSTWFSFFQATVSETSGSLLSYANVIQKVYIPRMIPPLAGALTALLDFLIVLAFVVTVSIVIVGFPGLKILLLPLFVVLTAALGFGLGLFFASAGAIWRDVRLGLPFLLQIMFYATPIVYAASLPKGLLAVVINLNPLTPLVDWYRWCIFPVFDPPSLVALVWPVLAALALSAAGAMMIVFLEAEIVDTM